MSNIKHFKGFSIVKGDIRVNVKLDRFGKQFHDAQFWLDTQVMTDMVPFMPHQSGTFVNRTRAKSAALAGTGQVCAGVGPEGRFLYMGKLMVDELTGSPWARKDAKKVVTDKNLVYNKSSNPNAQAQWYELAKAQHGKAWVKGVKQRAGGER
ncbi:MAG: minor capsid protein [Sporomusa sp.]